MQKILVTGAAGFIGHKTCELLLEDGYEVIGLDNMNDYYDVRLKEYRLESLQSLKNFQFYKCDIENYTDLEAIFKTHKFDAVLNLAARAGVRYSMENPHIYMTTNGHGSLNVLELMRYHGVKKYVLASTSSLYASQKMPFLETLAVNEPISPYAATKKAAETMAFTYHHLFDLDVTVVRYFTVYGEASRPDMAQFRFMRWIDEEKPIQLYGDGTQARDFTHVEDIARGTIAAMKAKTGFEVINLGGGQNPIEVNTMIKILESNLGKKAKVENLPFHKADMKVTWADITKAKKILDWEPKISFEEGIKRCVQNYLSNEFLKEISLN
jgi:UDP-glucuronate 4-epimerase